MELHGKPLLNYAVEAACASGVCGEVMVSTESKEVADIAKAAGAKVPFMRPADLARDPYGVEDVCFHVLDQYEKAGHFFDKLIILLPTSPLRLAADICEADKIFEVNNANFLMSVAEFDHNPFAALRSSDASFDVMEPCFPELLGRKRFELPQSFRCNGAVTILNVKAFRKVGTYYGSPLYTYIMPWERSIDIDTEMDLRFAEFLIKEGSVDVG